MIFPEVSPVVDFRKMPWAAVPPALPACRSMLMAAALASDVGLGPGLTCEILRAMPGFVAGHLARAERGVGGHHVQAGIVRSADGGQIEDSDVVARGRGCGFGADRNARGHGYGNGRSHGSSCSIQFIQASR